MNYLKRWTKDLPRVNPADVQDLEWISQSLGFSLRWNGDHEKWHSLCFKGAGENPLNHWNVPLRGIITSSLCVSQILTQTNLTWGFQWSKFPSLVNGWRFFSGLFGCMLFFHFIWCMTYIPWLYKIIKTINRHTCTYSCMGRRMMDVTWHFPFLTCKNTEGRCPGTTGDLVWSQIVKGMIFWKIRPGKLTWNPKIVGL